MISAKRCSSASWTASEGRASLQGQRVSRRSPTAPMPHGRERVGARVRPVRDGRVVAIDFLLDAEWLRALDLTVLDS
jgi:hypothetical protein